MDKTESLKNMLNNIINNKHEEASLDLHNYFTSKLRDLTGLDNKSQSDTSSLDTDIADERGDEEFK